MAKRKETSATESVAAPEGASVAAVDNSTIAPETATHAAVAPQNEADASAYLVADPNVEPDDVDRAAAGSWNDVTFSDGQVDGRTVISPDGPRRLTVTYKPGIYLRLGPGKNFAHQCVLPDGTEVTEAPVPSYAKVPGWLCVAVGGADGSEEYGWVDESLVTEVPNSDTSGR